jgi:hypothetical protein
MHNMRGDARVVGMQQQIIDQMRAELKTLPEVDEDAEVYREKSGEGCAAQPAGGGERAGRSSGG